MQYNVTSQNGNVEQRDAVYTKIYISVVSDQTNYTCVHFFCLVEVDIQDILGLKMLVATIVSIQDE